MSNIIKKSLGDLTKYTNPLFVGTILLLLYAIYMASNVLWPFFFSFIVAYLLNPAVEKLSHHKVSRTLSSLFITIIFVVAVITLLLFVIPLLRGELINLAKNLPGYMSTLQDYIINFLNKYENIIEPNEIRNKISDRMGDILAWGMNFLTTLFTSSLVIANILSLIVITPVVTFYLLRDWPIMINTIMKFFPDHKKGKYASLMHDIDMALKSYLRGQALVCLSLGIYYAFALKLMGLKYGITIGITSGILAFIPYIGTFTAFSISIAVAISQFADFYNVSLVIGIFFIGQIIENTFLVPNFVGDRVGIHPVWIIFALLSAGSIFGFVGVLFALPIAAIVSVLIKFSIKSEEDEQQ